MMYWRVAITVPDWVAVCFNAPVVETYREFDRYRHPGFGRLGPDLCKPDADLDECAARMVGIDARSTTLNDTTGRPQYLVDLGQPIAELI